MAMNHDDWLHKRLQVAEFAAEYLSAAREDYDPETYLRALEQLAAFGKKTHFSEGHHDENGKNED